MIKSFPQHDASTESVLNEFITYIVMNRVVPITSTAIIIFIENKYSFVGEHDFLRFTRCIII